MQVIAHVWAFEKFGVHHIAWHSRGRPSGCAVTLERADAQFTEVASYWLAAKCARL
jgi:hypothetical protein